MIKNIVLQFTRIALQDESAQRMMADYKQALTTPDLEFLRTTLLTMKGLMAQNLLSKWVVALPIDEKEIIINVYYHLNNVIDFLLSPKIPTNIVGGGNAKLN